MGKIGVICGTVRPNARSLTVANWITLKKDNYELIDLSKFSLGHYDEPYSPRSSKGYVKESTQIWSETISSFDGYIFVVPEYNGYFPGVLKDAIDYLYKEWEGKPFSLIGLGGKGGIWACDHLKTLLERFQMDCKGITGLKEPWESVSSDGIINETYFTASLDSILI